MMNYFLNMNTESEDNMNQHLNQMGEPDLMDMNLPLTLEEKTKRVDKLKDFFVSAPTKWDVDNPIQRFPLMNGEYISCILWNHLFFITGTDIVRSLVFRFECYGRPVKNFKKFEEGIFSDLRNLKPGIDAILEEPRSEFLEMLYRSNCIRTQKKQKVFFWYSVPHDRLFIDALERDLKRESMGTEPTTEDVMEISEDDEEREDDEAIDKALNEDGDLKDEDSKKRHPLAHSGIPKRVDHHLIYDHASLNPGNNSNAIQQQQRQLLEQNGLAYPLSNPNVMQYPWDYSRQINPNMFTPPQNYLLPYDMSYNSPYMNQMAFSPQVFCNSLFQSPQLSDDLGSFDMLSPNLDFNRNTTFPANHGLDPTGANPFATFMGLPQDPFMSMPAKPFSHMRHPMMGLSGKEFSPYPLPPKLNKLPSHQNHQPEPVERPHVCQVEYCGRAFKRSDQLRRHQKTHEHPNPCPHDKCPRTFNRKDQLAQHLALHHPEHLKQGEINPNARILVTSPSDQEGSDFTPEMKVENLNDIDMEANYQNWSFQAYQDQVFDTQNSYTKNEPKTNTSNLGFNFDAELSALDLMGGF